jgi:hypothetical protein
MERSSQRPPSLVQLLEDLGLEKILWLVLSKQEIHVIEHSKSVNSSFLDAMKEANDIDWVKNWVRDTINSHIDPEGGSPQTVLYVKSDSYNNLTVVMSEDINDSREHLNLFRTITRLALIYIQQQDKINSLENALRLGVSQLIIDKSYEESSGITSHSLKPRFVEDVIPHIFYSVVHETYGPYIFQSMPDEMKMNHDHIITAVKLFSSIDAEMVAEMGHLFTTNPIKSPIVGETFSIIFTLPSPRARGGHEVHALSALIPSQFYNLSKSLTGELKTAFFMHVEEIRIAHDQHSWALGVEPLPQKVTVPDFITEVMVRLRKSLALYFALKLDPNDVINW